MSFKPVDPMLSGHTDPTAERMTRSEVENACKLGAASASVALRALDKAIENGRSVAIFYHRTGNYFAMHDVAEIESPNPRIP